jgi:hypothetical protein
MSARLDDKTGNFRCEAAVTMPRRMLGMKVSR